MNVPTPDACMQIPSARKAPDENVQTPNLLFHTQVKEKYEERHAPFPCRKFRYTLSSAS